MPPPIPVIDCGLRSSRRARSWRTWRTIFPSRSSAICASSGSARRASTSTETLRCGMALRRRRRSSRSSTRPASRRRSITGFDEASTGGHARSSPTSPSPRSPTRHPERFIPFAGVDIMRGAAAVRDVEHWIRERGFRGLSLRPFMIGLPADDRHYYPVLREVRRARRAGEHPRVGQLDDVSPERSRPPAPLRSGRLRLPRPEADPQPRRLSVGARGVPARVEAPQRLPRARGAPAASTSPRRAPAGSRCCATARRRSRTRSSTAPAPS